MAGTRAYLTAEGRLVGTQAEAGKGFTQVEVPYGKAEQLAFINDLVAREASQVPVGREAPAQEGEPHKDHVVPYPKFLGGTRPVADPTCPYCKRSRSEAERVSAKLDQGDRTDAFVFALDELTDPFSFERIEAAIAERRAELGL